MGAVLSAAAHYIAKFRKYQYEYNTRPLYLGLKEENSGDIYTVFS